MAGPAGNGSGPPPLATRAVVQGELLRALHHRRRNEAGTVLLLRAAPEWRDAAQFEIEDLLHEDAVEKHAAGTQKVPVAVAACPTVLSVLEALAAEREPGRYLVILTPLETTELGASVLARGIRDEVKSINRWDLVQGAFGARRVDPALTSGLRDRPDHADAASGGHVKDYRWVAEALLDAQPPGGWRRLAGPNLTRATALNRLAAARLGIESVPDETGVDAAALLEWTTDPASVARFLALREEERVGLIEWLTGTAGHTAEVVFRLDATGKITDAVPFGLVIVALFRHEETLTARVRAEERYLAGVLPSDENASSDEKMGAFGEAAESLVERWADNGHAPLAAAMSERAERILRDLGGSAAAGESKVLEAGLDARLTALAQALTAVLDALIALPAALPSALTPATPSALHPDLSTVLMAAEEALGRVVKHGRKRGRDSEVHAAEAAVRLARWLATPEEPPATLADAATRMLRSWSWADRCLEVIYRADTSRVPRLDSLYARLWERVRTRRAGLDEVFTRRLAAWTQGSADPDGLLLVENLLERVAKPVTGRRPPVIVVLDGMTAAIGSQLADDIATERLWVEAGRQPDGREPALATVPSVTAMSRTSLLSGALVSGGQSQERAGFTAFWGRRDARLFHKADLLPEPAQSLAGGVREAIADPAVIVAIVLNAIDDALDNGPRRPSWKVDDVDYLRAILIEARKAGRPVILTADHGHVLDRGADLRREPRPGHDERASTGDPEAARPVAALSESARHRVGTAGRGEITVHGPRVLGPDGKPGGEIVAAVDEAIRYLPRKVGYHGGASPAEVVVPVITLLPSTSLLPPDWHAYDATGHAPAWWHAPTSWVPPPDGAATQPQSAPSQPTAGRSKKRPTRVVDDPDALFGVAEVEPSLTPPDSPSASASAVAVPAQAARSGSGSAPRTVTLGAQIAVSARMTAQRQFVRRAPGDASITALVDALVRAGGRLTVTEVAVATGEPPVRMSGYLAQVARLLNVDSYPVLTLKDGGAMVELNEQLLLQQFLMA
jgi:hypothetical protein